MTPLHYVIKGVFRTLPGLVRRRSVIDNKPIKLLSSIIQSTLEPRHSAQHILSTMSSAPVFIRLQKGSVSQFLPYLAAYRILFSARCQESLEGLRLQHQAKFT